MNTYVYYVRPGENEELRYSLRTLEYHAPPGDVVVVGGYPNWLDTSKVHLLAGNYGHSPEENALIAIKEACSLIDGDFYIMNDDFISLQNWPDPFPVWHGGSIQDFIGVAMKDPKSANRRASFALTGKYLEWCGIESPWHYELHTPMLINGAMMKSIFAELHSDFVPEEFHPPALLKWRTLYGNLAYPLRRDEHVRRLDVKMYTAHQWPGFDNLDFLSTADYSFRNFELILQVRYPRPSRFELPSGRLSS